jgi:Flp pilus assembly protein TadB
MLHYWMHAAAHPWQEQLLYGGLICAAILLLFLFLWWRKRAARPRQGDFAALVQRPSIAEALDDQQQSPLADAADAWQQTQTALNSVKTGVERVLALVWLLLSGLLCAISILFVLIGLVKFPALNWGQQGFFLALAVVCGWFARAQWRDLRGVK